jgi:hypothetical protein
VAGVCTQTPPADPEEEDFLPQSGARVALSEHGFPMRTPHPAVRRGLSTDPGHGYAARPEREGILLTGLHAGV